MKMWIRAQDGSSLTKMKCVKICKKQRTTDWGVLVDRYYIYNMDICIGMYASKERCIEIIDDITKHLENMHKDLIDNIQDRNMVEVHTIYHMPNE